MKYRAGQIIHVPDQDWKHGPPDEPECSISDDVLCNGDCVRCPVNEPDYEAMSEARGLL